MTILGQDHVTVAQSIPRPKPAYKSPCTHCGLCCSKKPCSIGKLMFATDEGPCPALQWDPDGASACGLIRDPARYAPTRARIKGPTALRAAMKLLVAAGKGCQVRSREEPIDKDWVARARCTAEEGIKARKIWGIPNDETQSLIDHDRLVRIFHHLGQRLTATTTLCVIGSAPAILVWPVRAAVARYRHLGPVFVLRRGRIARRSA
jgi:hypothetical protein